MDDLAYHSNKDNYLDRCVRVTNGAKWNILGVWWKRHYDIIQRLTCSTSVPISKSSFIAAISGYWNPIWTTLLTQYKSYWIVRTKHAISTRGSFFSTLYTTTIFVIILKIIQLTIRFNQTLFYRKHTITVWGHMFLLDKSFCNVF